MPFTSARSIRKSAYPCETSLGFDAQRRIAAAAAVSRDQGRLPIVLGGNCNTAVGGASGVHDGSLGVIWFDAHSDFCTPETTETGVFFFDGMGLAMLAGRCWRGMLSAVPGYVADRRGTPLASSARVAFQIRKRVIWTNRM